VTIYVAILKWKLIVNGTTRLIFISVRFHSTSVFGLIRKYNVLLSTPSILHQPFVIFGNVLVPKKMKLETWMLEHCNHSLMMVTAMTFFYLSFSNVIVCTISSYVSNSCKKLGFTNHTTFNNKSVRENSSMSWMGDAVTLKKRHDSNKGVLTK